MWARMSLLYTNQSIQFCRVDVSLVPKLAKKYGISTEATEKQLPTLMMIENGKETGRFPPKPGKSKVPVSYVERHIVRYLEIESKFYQTNALT